MEYEVDSRKEKTSNEHRKRRVGVIGQAYGKHVGVTKSCPAGQKVGHKAPSTISISRNAGLLCSLPIDVLSGASTLAPSTCSGAQSTYLRKVLHTK